jgi:2-desacetyl-2-hydroxyethyl bacteriochlorophyllide A dehydrogenase
MLMGIVSSHDARAFWVAAVGRGEIRTETLSSPTTADVVVHTRFSGISRGTESLVFRGHVPASEYQRMRAPFQQGDFPAPVKYGYCNVGVVETGPADLLGRTVFTLYPHQTRFVMPAEKVHVVPDEVPAGRAVLAANMETALNGVWDAGILPGDRVAVVGGGTVGCLVAWLAGRIPGCEVVLVDVNPARSAIATRLGVAFSTGAASSAAALGSADVVVHASGTSAGLATALALAGFESTVVDLSWYGDQPVQVPLGGAFHSQRLSIASSQVGQVAARQRTRWTYRRRLTAALRLLNDDALDALITGESPFEELPTVMARLSTTPGDTLCHRILYA